jgi:hypothetical protein
LTTKSAESLRRDWKLYPLKESVSSGSSVMVLFRNTHFTGSCAISTYANFAFVFSMTG